MKHIKNSTTKYVSVLFFGAIFYILNVKTHFVADDFNYHFMFGPDRPRISSIKDIFISQYYHYQVMNGRSVAHFFAQLFLYMGKDVFNIINTIVYILMILLMMWHIQGNVTFKWKLFTILNLIVWLFIPAYGQTILWLDGSANYLLMTTLILGAFLPFRLYFKEPDSPAKSYYIIVVPLISFFAGWASDNTSAGFVLLILMTMVYYYFKERKRPPMWMGLSLVTSIAGFLVMSLAPAQFIRINDREWQPFATKFLNTWDMLITEYGVISLIFIVCCLIYVFKLNHELLSTKIMFPIMYYLTSVAIFSAVIIPGMVPERANFGSSVFMIIAVISVIQALLSEDPSFKIIVSNVILLALILVSSISFVKGYRDISRSHEDQKIRVELIEAQKAQGLTDLKIPAIEVKDRHNGRYGLKDVVDNPVDWPNNRMALYYGVESIVRE